MPFDFVITEDMKSREAARIDAALTEMLSENPIKKELRPGLPKFENREREALFDSFEEGDLPESEAALDRLIQATSDFPVK